MSFAARDVAEILGLSMEQLRKLAAKSSFFSEPPDVYGSHDMMLLAVWQELMALGFRPREAEEITKLCAVAPPDKPIVVSRLPSGEWTASPGLPTAIKIMLDLRLIYARVVARVQKALGPKGIRFEVGRADAPAVPT